MHTLRVIGKDIILFALTLLLFLLVLPRLAYSATNYTSGDSVILRKSEIIDANYFASGSSVVINGTVNGDLYAAGGTVLIDGTINGDVLAAGGNVTFSGIVNGNIRTAGGQILITGNVARNITAVGGSITINSAESTKGSLVAAGGNISILSRIEHDATLAGGNIVLTEGATIMGALNYWSDRPASIAQSNRVNGGISFHQTQHKTNRVDKEREQKLITPFFVLWSAGSLLMTFLIGLFFIKILPNYTKEITTTMMRQPWKSLGIGIIAAIIAPISIILLCVSLIGIPLAISIILAYILIMIVNEIFISIIIGEKIIPNHPVWGLVIGLVICSVIMLIPGINILVGMILFFVTTGALLTTKKNMYTRLRRENIL